MSSSRKGKAKVDNKKQQSTASGSQEKADDQEQLEEYAFNLYGWAYKHGLEGRKKSLMVNGHASSTTKWVKAVEKIEDAGGTVTWRAATDPYTERETDEQYVGGGVRRYLVVGVCPPLFDSKIHAIKPASLKDGTPVGVFQPAEDQLIQPHEADDPQSARPPLLVVTPIMDGPPVGGTKYFALWTRKAGLPVVNSTDRDSTFFFSEFRDSVTRGKVREKTWKALIESQSVRSGLAEPADANKLVVYKRSRDSTFKASLNPPTSFYGDLNLLKYAIETTGPGNDHETACDRLEELLTSQLEVLHFSPSLDAFRSLLRLIDDEDEDAEDGEDTAMDVDESFDAAEFRQELRKHFPDLDLDESFLRDLRSAIVRTKTDIPLDHVRVFLAACSTMSRTVGKSEADTDELVKGAAEIARLGVGHPSKIQSSKPGASSIARAVIGRLQDIIRYQQQAVDSLVNMGGDALDVQTPFQLFEASRNLADYDTAKAVFGETSRWLAQKLAFAYRGSVQMLKDLVEVLQGQEPE